MKDLKFTKVLLKENILILYDLSKITKQISRQTSFKTSMEDTTTENCPLNNLETKISNPKAKKKKPGIVYLGTLPPFMNVTKVKDIFSQFGPLGRIFLQPAESKSGNKKKKKPAIHYSEGWIEFESKKIAKEVALTLNNTQIGGKKSSKFYDYMWNIKYLPRFKWIHLCERLAYERAVHKQKLRAEIAQAKREANFYAFNLEKSKKSKKNVDVSLNSEFKQRQTEDTILELNKNENDRKEFLKSLFAKS